MKSDADTEYDKLSTGEIRTRAAAGDPVAKDDKKFMLGAGRDYIAVKRTSTFEVLP